MEAGGSGQLSRWKGGPRPEEGVELYTKSGAPQYRSGGWGGGWGVGTRRVMVNDPENSRNGGVGVDKT